MKLRLSYFLISGILIISIFTGTWMWRKNNLVTIPNGDEKSYTTPKSAKYMPQNADLVFHWKINPTILPDYIGNLQDKINKTIASKNSILIRDSLMKFLSLNFERDIEKWVGEIGSFAFLDNDDHTFSDWIMALEINKGFNSDEVLKLIQGEKNIDPTFYSINKLNISDSKLISRKTRSNHLIYFATDKDYILIASNPNIIKLSIENLEINKLSAKEKYQDIKFKNHINDGILLLEMSPNKIFNLIGQKESIFELNKTKKLITSINIFKNQLNIEGIVSFEVKNENTSKIISYDSINQENELEFFEDYIFINNPKQYFGANSNTPIQKSIASVIQKSTTNDYSNLFKIILENTKGNLIWVKDKDWLVLTGKSDTNKKEINDILIKDNFFNSYIDFKKKGLEIWSKFSNFYNEKPELRHNIEAIIQESDDAYIWSKSLSAISNYNDNKYFANIDYQNKKDETNDFEDIFRMHLGKEKTELFLDNFYPYILLRTLTGNKLKSPKNIDISFSNPSINYPDFMKFKINLKTS